MKTKIKFLLVIGISMMSAVCQAQNDALLIPDPKDTVIETIDITETSVAAIIYSLADMAGLNVTIDPKITEGVPGADGKPIMRSVPFSKMRNVTAREALAAYLENCGYMAKIDPRNPKIARITIKDPAAKEPVVVKTMYLKYADPSTNWLVMLRAMLPQTTVHADPISKNLLILTTETAFTDVSNLVVKLDVPQQQVLIEAKFIETAKNPKSVKGIDWSGTLEAQRMSFGNGYTGAEGVGVLGSGSLSSGSSRPSGGSGASVTTASGSGSEIVTTSSLGGSGGSSSSSQNGGLMSLVGNPGMGLNTAKGFYPNTAFLNADGVKAVVSFLNTESDTEYIAAPRAVTLEGMPAILQSIENVPIFEENLSQGAAGAAAISAAKPNYSQVVAGSQTPLNEVGIKLMVTPKIRGSSDIFLMLEPEISGQSGTARAVLGGKANEAPIFKRQRLQTQAVVPSGNTLVLGGLVTDSTTKGYTKVPLLGDMPGLGMLFRKDSKERNKRNLIIFVTPSIVQPNDFQPTTSTYLKTKQLEKPDLDTPAWDSGAPASKTRPLF